MGLFGLFKKTTTIEHDTFGTLTFMKIKKNPQNNYFEGSGLFKPTGNKVEYFITASIDGPTREQVSFYEKIQSDYNILSKKCSEMIEAEFKNCRDDFKITDFNAEFTLVAMTIPNQNNKPMEWHLAFETEHDENHHFTVYFKDFEPEYVGVDG